MRLLIARLQVAAVLFSVWTLVPGGLSAQTLPDEWKFAAFVYGYVPKISGSTTFPTGTTANISVDPSQIISNLKFTFMGSLAAQKGPGVCSPTSCMSM